MNHSDAPTRTHLPTDEPPAADAGSGDEPLLTHAGPYAIESVVGRGGMGIVYRVRDDACERELAVKVLQARLAGDASAVARFEREAKLTARLQHPAIPPVHAIGTLDDGRPFFAMKLIQGQTFADLLRAGAERSRLLAVFVQVAQAVGYAHQLGVVHRDLKPANVMVGAFGEVQVMDWGLAKLLTEASVGCQPQEDVERENPSVSEGDATQAGSVMGTLAYMPPEQARGDEVDARADVFALGAILCEILTGRPPVWGGDLLALLCRARSGDLAEAFARLDGCDDAALAALAKRCLATDASDRPADAAAVAEAILAHQADVAKRLQQAEQERATALVREAEARKRRRLTLTLVGVVAVALLAAGGVWLWLAQLHAAGRAQVEYAVEQAGEALGRDDLLAARGSVDRAKALLAQAGEPADLVALVGQRAADVDVAERIEEIRAPARDAGEANDNRRSADRQYTELFREIGIDVDALPTDEAARRIEASVVRGQLLIALHDWVVPRQAARRDEPASWGRLLDLAGRLDPQPWREGMRDAVRRQDRAALLEQARTAAVRDHPPAVLLLGEALVSQGEVEAAVALARRGRWQYPGDFLLHCRCGYWQQVVLRRTSSEDALGSLAAALALRPRRADVWASYAKALESAQRFPEAIQACERAIELDADYPESYFVLASIHRQSGNPREHVAAAERGIVVFRRSLEANPEYGFLWNRVGLCLAESGRDEEALAAYRRAIEVEPEASWPHRNLGNALRKLGRPREGLPHLRRAVELRPQIDQFHSSLLGALREIGEQEEAAELGLSRLATQPNTRIYSELGHALRTLNRLDEAVAISREGVRRVDEILDSGMIYNNLAFHLLSKGASLAEAESTIQEALRRRPRDKTANLTLAEVRQAQGRFEESLAAFRKGHELQAEAVNLQSRFPTARWVKDAERLVELDRQLPGVLSGKATPRTAAEGLEFARVCVYKSMHASALKFQREAFRLDPRTEPANRYQAARCALLLADGHGPEATGISDEQKARLRRDALAWLKADLERWKAAPRMTALKAVNHADTHDDLLAVRDPARRERLPADERSEWAAFWAEVKAFREKVNLRP